MKEKFCSLVEQAIDRTDQYVNTIIGASKHMDRVVKQSHVPHRGSYGETQGHRQFQPHLNNISPVPYGRVPFNAVFELKKQLPSKKGYSSRFAWV
ncbi:hypothetical protein DSO57_1010608 [Entomophthora muscae]|uniref:Uncharacterized protein n=1 Tax=Entomophthora muscae TaxID=34485 RepID=A0ACC2US55_9FUNG|nr:hypothetical protein DSO57_1010608 [Entomophthora muscae]